MHSLSVHCTCTNCIQRGLLRPRRTRSVVTTSVEVERGYEYLLQVPRKNHRRAVQFEYLAVFSSAKALQAAVATIDRSSTGIPGSCAVRSCTVLLVVDLDLVLPSRSLYYRTHSTLH